MARMANLQPIQRSAEEKEKSVDRQEKEINLEAKTESVPKAKPVETPLPPKEPKAIPPIQPKTLLLPEQEISKWLAIEIEQIFQASLSNHISPGLIQLTSLASELESELLSEDNLEAIFMEILTDLGAPKPSESAFEYLYLVYHNTFRAKRILPVKSNLYQKKIAILNKIIKLAASYGFICFQIPDMFINDDPSASIALLFRRFNDLSPFFVDIVNSSIEQDSLLDLLNIVMPIITAQKFPINIQDSMYVTYLAIFETLVNIKPVAAVFSQIVGFQPPDKTQGLDFEFRTILGRLLRLSPLEPNVVAYYFTDDAKNLSKEQRSRTYETLTTEFKVLNDRLFSIIDKLIRGSPQTRNDILVWFADLVNISHLRKGYSSGEKYVAGDAIMYNISIILMKLSLPFLSYPMYSKIDKIDMDYFVKSSIIDVKEESRVNSSIEELAEEYPEQMLKDVNFISHCFFLSLTYLHYGMGGIFTRYEKIDDNIKNATENVATIESGRYPHLTHQLPQYKDRLNVLYATKYTIQALFSARSLQLEVFDFIIGSTSFLTRVIDPTHQYPQKKVSVPLFAIKDVSELDDRDFLKTKTPKPWKYYPEYLLEGIISYCKFLMDFAGCPLIQNQEKLELFVEFSTILLRCPELIGNPHLKATIVQMLYIGSLPLNTKTAGFMAPVFQSNKFVLDNILYSLLDFYVMVEKTGASSQFYDKFTNRYYTSVVLEELWKTPSIRQQLKSYSMNNVDFFIRFIARMLNDTTYLLDETFTELNLIHKYQQEIKSRSQGNPPNEEEFGNDQELAKKLQSSERKTKSEMGLTNKTMELFKLFTKDVPQGFVLPEVVDRLAGMLDYNLSVLVGPRCSNLKVENPEKYGFDPKRTLGDLCEIYVNLSRLNKFVIAVSRDGRSFKLEYFQKAERILSTRTYTSAAVLSTLIKLAKRADKQRQLDEDEELELGEIPDEFLDPLMYSLMEDPVILPSSKVSIDRSTIKAHLLSDPTDPFNRMPLKIEDVVEDVDLKRKIEEFKLEKKAERLNKMDAEMDVEMEE
jgi:ubiquitin conjugation factor E4 B